MKLLRKLKEKKGFTLVEMLIVIGILTVLMSVAAPNVVSYAKRIKLMELDDSARSIFMAAQNRLVSLKSVGTDITFGDASIEVAIEDVPDEFKDLLKDEAGNKIEGSYIEYTSPKVRAIKSAAIKSHQIEDLSGENIVGLSSIEGQLYNNNFVIEYDATTGFVYGVFYSEEDDLASYNMKNQERDFEDRLKAEKLVGYYGGGKLVEMPKGGTVDAPEVEYYDLEKLVFYVKWPEGNTSDKLNFSFTIWQLDETTGKRDESTKVVIVPESANEGECYYITKDQTATIILDSLAPGQGADNGKWNLPSGRDMSDYVLERDFKGWVCKNSDGTVGALNSDMWENNSYPMKDALDYVTSVDYKIDPGANIVVEIKFYDGTAVQDDCTKTYGEDGNKINSYFASLDNANAGIKAGRHLQNLANYVDGKLVSTAELLDTIDFSLDSGTYATWNSAVTYKGTDKSERAKYLYDFKPVGSQFVKDSIFLRSFDGHYSDKGYMIKYLRINADPDIHPEYKQALSDIYNNTAFFAPFLNNQIGNICFYCPVVKGYGEYTGVFYGHSKVGTNISDITVINPIVEGPGYVGGIAGAHSGGTTLTGWKVVVEPVEHYFDNYNYDYHNDNKTVTDSDGNIISWGNATTEDYSDWNDPFTDPYQRFVVRGTTEYKTGKNGIPAIKDEDIIAPLSTEADGEQKGPYAGGFFGYLSGVFKLASSSVRVESKGYAGGIAGYMTGNDMSNCYVGGHTFNGSFTGTYNGKEYNLINIYGEKGAGGLAGFTDSVGLNGTGIYTSCSVGSSPENIDNADTVFGVFSTGERNYGSNSAYSVGYIYSAKLEDGAFTNVKLEKMTSRSDNILSKQSKSIKYPVENQVVAETYDHTLANKYPYWNEMGSHIGDWPVDPPVFGVFYWEKSGGESRYILKGYNAKGDADGKKDIDIDTVSGKETGTIDDYGYGYFYTETVENATSTMLDGVGNVAEISEISEYIKENYEVLPEIVFVSTQGKASGGRSLTFEYSYPGDPDSSKTFYFNPDFCGVSVEDDLGTDDKPYQIRHVSQFKNIPNAQTSSFKQTLDLTFDSYVPISGDTVSAFSGKYDGNNQTITVESFGSATGCGFGLFGVTNGAELSEIKVTYSAGNQLSAKAEKAKNGFGGIVGIAVGGSIKDCAVSGFANKMETLQGETAIGGIAGYSSAAISHCTVTDGSLSAVADPNKPDSAVYVGGIAGSASGEISDCNVYDLKTELNRNSGLVIAGGIVGNNVDFIGATTLSVTNCTSTAALRRLSAVGGSVLQNVIIHPIAPTKMVVDFNDLDYYANEYFSGRPTWDGSLWTYPAYLYNLYKYYRDDVDYEQLYNWQQGIRNTYIQAWKNTFNDDYFIESGKELKDSGWFSKQDPIYELPRVWFLTGTGIKPRANTEVLPELDVTISNCSFAQGSEYYDSQIYGYTQNGDNIFGISPENVAKVTTKGSLTTLDDVYLTTISGEMLKYIEYNLNKPKVKIYSVYEKISGTNTAEKAIKVYDEGTTAISGEKKDGPYYPIGEYGLLVTFGRESDVFVNGKPISLGEGYKEIHNNDVSFSDGTFYSFSGVIADLERSKSQTLAVTYHTPSGLNSILNVSITAPQETPDAGVYEVRKRSDNSYYVTGSYMYNDKPAQMTAANENDGYKGEHGLMFEHSVYNPFDISKFTASIIWTDKGEAHNETVNYDNLSFVGTAAYNDIYYGAIRTQDNGRYYDFYAFDEKIEDIIKKIPEGCEYTVTVIDPSNGAGAPVSATFTKEIKIPYLGVYGVHGVRYVFDEWSKNEKNFIQYIVTKDNITEKSATEFKYNAISEEVSREPLDEQRYGIILEDGFDLENITVKLTGGVENKEINGKDLVLDDGAYTDASIEGENVFYPTINGKTLNLYYIPLDLVPESTNKITVTYSGYEVYTAEAEFKDLGVEPKGHAHVYDVWESDKDSHWRKCKAENCPQAGVELDKAAHTFGKWEENTATHLWSRVCSVCGYPETVTHEHDLEWVNSDSVHHWQVCEDEDCPIKGEPIGKEAHEFEYAGYDDVNHTKTCTKCGREISEQHKSSGGGTVSEDKTEITYTCECGYSWKENYVPKDLMPKMALLIINADDISDYYIKFLDSSGFSEVRQEYELNDKKVEVYLFIETERLSDKSSIEIVDKNYEPNQLYLDECESIDYNIPELSNYTVIRKGKDNVYGTYNHPFRIKYQGVTVTF